MLLNFNSPSYKSDICVSLMLRHLTFSVLISFYPNNDILNCSFIIQPINEKYIYFQGLFIKERSDATSPDMINGVNQNVIFLMIKKMLRPFSDKLANSKTQILFHRNTTMTSTVN